MTGRQRASGLVIAAWLALPAAGAHAAVPGRPLCAHVPATTIAPGPPPAPGPTGQTRCSTLPAQPTGVALATSGRWSRAYVDLPHYAIHAVLLPTGRVLFWGFEWTRQLATKLPRQIEGRAAIWDPQLGTGAASIHLVPPPHVDLDHDGVPERVPLYCSGQTVLRDGRVLVAGGLLSGVFASTGYRFPPGHRLTLVLDPESERWTLGPPMSVGRWYPTATTLPDGRALLLGGFDDRKDNDLTSALDVLSPDAGRIDAAPSAARRVGLYPPMAVLPSGDVLLAGPQAADVALLDAARMAWRTLPPLDAYRGGANLVLTPGSRSRAMLVGGTDLDGYFEPLRAAPARADTAVLDPARPQDGFRPGPRQRRARFYPNTVLLPDGTMVTLGGSSGVTAAEGNYTPSKGNRRVELWDPRTDRWRLGPAQREDRTYHSVALLLPDGRVWSAGDDANPTRDGDTAELYEPPYLFKGPRPVLTAAPKALRAGVRVTVRASGDVTGLSLMSPSAVTHAVDMHQGFSALRVISRRRSGSATTLTAVLPASAGVQVPGPRMLFAVSRRGAVSRARWVRVAGRTAPGVRRAG